MEMTSVSNTHPAQRHEPFVSLRFDRQSQLRVSWLGNQCSSRTSSEGMTQPSKPTPNTFLECTRSPRDSYPFSGRSLCSWFLTLRPAPQPKSLPCTCSSSQKTPPKLWMLQPTCRATCFFCSRKKGAFRINFRYAASRSSCLFSRVFGAGGSGGHT